MIISELETWLTSTVLGVIALSTVGSVLALFLVWLLRELATKWVPGGAKLLKLLTGKFAVVTYSWLGGRINILFQLRLEGDVFGVLVHLFYVSLRVFALLLLSSVASLFAALKLDATGPGPDPILIISMVVAITAFAIAMMEALPLIFFNKHETDAIYVEGKADFASFVKQKISPEGVEGTEGVREAMAAADQSSEIERQPDLLDRVASDSVSEAAESVEVDPSLKMEV